MPFPHYPDKHRRAPLYTAAEYREYVARHTKHRVPHCPRSVVLVFGRGWRRYLTWRYRRPILAEYDLYRVNLTVGVSALGGPGSPNAVLYVEELFALGARRFIVVGMAGSLQPAARVGSLVVCTKALRDEGTSHHYVKSGTFAHPSRPLVAKLQATLDRHHVPYERGPTWTTDAPYRETLAEVRQYRRAGILTVEMEAAAILAVTRSLGSEGAALFVISDHLDERGWEPRFHDSRRRLRDALSYAIEALAR